jgi:hypothetical protein
MLRFGRSKLATASFLASVGFISLIAPVSGVAGSWVKVAAAAPGGAGVMLLLTDGTVMVQQSNGKNWMRLTPSATGSYAAGSWTLNPIAPMSIERLYFASQVLQSGKVWVMGGEYSGPGLPAVFSPTAEIYDPATNTWSPAATFPNQPGLCGTGSIAYNASVTSGSNTITGIPSTANFYVGWTVTGTGIPAGTTITSIDSLTQVHISNNATATNGNALLTFRGTRPACFGDTPSIVLPGGKILAGSLIDRTSYLYTTATDSWAQTGTKLYDQSDEEGWSLQSTGRVLTYDIFKSVQAGSGFAELYNPVLGTWSSISPGDGTATGTLPLLSSSALGFELGPVLRLQDGRTLVIGANGLTAIYTPGSNSWAAGPTITGTLNGNPATFGADDAPAAILPNGHVILAADAGPAAVSSTGNATAGSNIITNIPSTVLFQVGWSVAQSDGNTNVIPGGATVTSVDSTSQIHISRNAVGTQSGIGLKFGGIFSAPTQLFDFNPAGAGTVSALAAPIPDPGLTNLPAFVTRMVALPTGQILFADGSSQLYIYTGDGTVNPTLRPVISNITYNGGGTFTLTGKQLNGQSAGSDYGDDNQSDSNYPILRLVNAAGTTYYCRTTNWSNVAVGIGTATQTVNFTLNPALPAGNYSAIVSGAGISSFPVAVAITAAQLNLP